MLAFRTLINGKRKEKSRFELIPFMITFPVYQSRDVKKFEYNQKFIIRYYIFL